RWGSTARRCASGAAASSGRRVGTERPVIASGDEPDGARFSMESRGSGAAPVEVHPGADRAGADALEVTDPANRRLWRPGETQRSRAAGSGQSVRTLAAR